MQMRLVNKKDLPLGSNDRTGYVYFLADGDITKIGMTSNPANRIGNLISDNSIEKPIIYLSDSHSKYMDNELILHSLYSSCRHKGEWFCISIDEIKKEYPDLDMGRISNLKNQSKAPKKQNQVRMTEQTKKQFDEVAKEVNEKRKKAGLLELSTAGLLHEAVRLLIVNKREVSK